MSDRSQKGSIRHASNIQHIRIDLTDDYEVVAARTSSLRGPAGLPSDSAKSYLKGHTTWVVGDDWAPEDDYEAALDPNSSQFDEAMEASIGEVMDRPKATKQPRSQALARPNIFWKRHYRDQYLDELLRFDGRGDFLQENECPDCVARSSRTPLKPEFRCMECFTPDLICASCCVRRHSRMPLHQIEKWTGAKFVHISLKELGLTIHLNHGGMRCRTPNAVNSRFVVLHTNGIHEVAISYCGCAREVPRPLQLLRRGLYPASQQNVRTCATFSLLRMLHALSLTAKISTYDFYRALENLTPGSVLKRPKSRYRPLMRMLTQWRHLKLLKHGGRGHNVSGAGRTSNGELALLCPSCPHPEINLDDGWRDVPDEMRFLYALFICLDTNFRLKSNLISNYSQDPGLGVGFAYLVPRIQYEEYVVSQADEKDISTCVGFQALAKATTRNTRGLRYTGVAAVVCARSEMFLPNAVGNLQKGERYANVDYVFASSIRFTTLLIVAISYDIACQWFTNLFRRIVHWPGDLKLRPGLHLRPFIPKFHAPAHKEENHEQYSLNLAEGAGMTDGEAIERVWGSHNALANSTKITGPGTRQDILDDNFSFWNFNKYISMGSTLMRRYKAAISDRNQQVEAHRGFTASLPPNVAREWEEACVRWSADSFPKTEPNPYRVDGAAVSDDDVRKILEEEEAAARLAANQPPRHEMSATSFIYMGLELEDSQRQVKELAEETSPVPMNLQGSELKDRRAALRKQLQSWEDIRLVYMPGLLQYAADVGQSLSTVWDSNPHAEDVKLWLPSSLPADRRAAVCNDGVPELELRARTAQCGSSLDDLRLTLRLKTRMVYYKLKNIRGQKDGTRSRAAIDEIHRRAIRFVRKYHVARNARMQLEGPGAWELVYQVLKNEDVRSYSERRRRAQPNRRGIWEDGEGPGDSQQAEAFESSESEENATDIEMGDVARQTEAQQLKKRKKGTGETRKELSWIWKAAPMPVDGNDAEADRILKAEWARSRARSCRAREEVQLLLEEMRRVRAFLAWSQQCWTERANGRTVADPALREGIRAYASKQAELQGALSESFQSTWKIPLKDVDAGGDSAQMLEEFEAGESLDADSEPITDGPLDADGDDDISDDESSSDSGGDNVGSSGVNEDRMQTSDSE